MENQRPKETSLCGSIAVNLFVLLFLFLSAPVFSQGLISKRVSELKLDIPVKVLFRVEAPDFSRENANVISRSTTLSATAEVADIIRSKPEYLRLNIPIEGGARQFPITLYKVAISPGGLNLLTNGVNPGNDNNIVNYRGAIEGDSKSVVSFTFSGNETMGFISNDEGNYVLGKPEKTTGNRFIIYNDKDLTKHNDYKCDKEMIAANNVPQPALNALARESTSSTAMTTKCVNWYWETAYNVYQNKGSVANVNAYMQGVFNEVATLYANDGISINLKTLFVWSSPDPYIGTTPSNYLSQFGSYRTSWDGDLAHLISFSGNGGLAYVNGLQMCEYGVGQVPSQMGFSGVNSYYNNVPTYSWTVNCLAHEMGHQLGSSHTHDCVWNGNGTKIDDCGGSAGYSSGICLPMPSPLLPVGGGTIMSYCQLTSVGINFNLGFGPQPRALIIANINRSSCLTSCNTCVLPAQPGTITGQSTICSNTTQTYTIAAVAEATSYTWTLPSGWSGTSATNTITVMSGTQGGDISVKANNGCGSSTNQTLSVIISSGAPAQPGVITGPVATCASSVLTYSVHTVSGAIGYTWTLPSGWSGTSNTNSITVNTTITGGTISVKANNGCGISTISSLSVTASPLPGTPGTITVSGGTAAVCTGESRTYTVPAVSGLSYTWIAPTGATITSGQGTNSIVLNFGTGFINSGYLSVKANNSCTSGAAGTLLISRNLPAMPGAITVTGGIAKICKGESRAYSITAISGITYNWIVPAGATITAGQGSNTVTVSFNGSFVSGSAVMVKATNGCGTSAARSISISTNFPGQPSSIAVSGGIAKVCSGDIRTYSVTGGSDLIFHWVIPTGAVISSGQGTNSISVIYGSGFISGGVISVTASNNCGTGVARTLNIAQNLPAVPGSITGPANVCSGSSDNYSISAVTTATSYVWTVPTGASITSDPTAKNITAFMGSSSGQVTVKSSNACGLSGAKSFSVYINCPAGNFEYPAVKENSGINIETSAEPSVYPSPVENGNITLKFFAAEASMYNLVIYDLAGRNLQSEPYKATAGINIKPVHLNNFARGIYFLAVENAKGKKTLKFEVR